MEDQPASEYCPRCLAVQPTFSFTEDSRPVRRCQICGFPVETGLVVESDESPRPSSTPDVKILCVDDDPLIVQLFGDILRFHGYTVLCAGDGETALEVAARERPAAILLDIMMSGIDGFEVCRRLKADRDLKAIPVIILTAMNDPKLSAHAFEVGAQLALQKPASPTVILHTVQAALSLARSRPTDAPAEAMAALPACAPEVQPDLSVPTHLVPLTIWTVDGMMLSARIFLRLHAEGHAGPETVSDRLNDLDLFLALSVPGELPVIFLNKTQVIRVEAEEQTPRDVVESAVGVCIDAITVQLINGDQLSGSVRLEGPAGKRRISDFLNTRPAFLPLQGAERLHLLHKRFIARIIPRKS
jgi:CheY-like chemotaxis protein